MTRSGARAVHRLARSPLPRLSRRSDPGDGGFILLESMIAITLITLLAAALGTFFVNGVASTNQQRARQFATQVAATAIEGLRSVPASDLKTGRDQNSVTHQFESAPAAAAPWIDPTLMSRDFSDNTAADGSGATALVPASATPVTINGKSFTVNRYLGVCAAPRGNSADCTVARRSDPAALSYIRAAVAVAWSDSHCADGTCVYATGTVLTDAEDATFNLNQIPFAPPVVVNPGRQTSMVTDPVSLPVAVQANTGVP